MPPVMRHAGYYENKLFYCFLPLQICLRSFWGLRI